MRKISILTLSVLLLASVAVAQEEAAPKKPPLSPAAKAETKLSNGKALTVDYSAPSMRERKIMGELVPFDKVWRTGANAATKLTTEGDIMLGSIHVPAGTYSLYTIPGEKEWTLIVNKQTGQSGGTYDEKQDLGRTKMSVKSTKEPVETFVIDAKPSVLTMTWENTQVSVPVIAH